LSSIHADGPSDLYVYNADTAPKNKQQIDSCSVFKTGTITYDTQHNASSKDYTILLYA